MTCDTGANKKAAGPYVAELPGIERASSWSTQTPWDNPLEFALFGLARQDEMPGWICADWSLPVLDLGPGNKLIKGAKRLEYPEYNFESPEFNPPATVWHSDDPNADKPNGRTNTNPNNSGVRYFDKTSKYRCFLPFDDNSVGGIYAVNIFEHLWDPRPIMEECARVLAPGAPLNIVVPHGSHGIYLQDLDHKKPFILDSWKNWLQNGYWGPDRSALRLRIGVNFKFGIKEENVNIMTQLIKESQ